MNTEKRGLLAMLLGRYDQYFSQLVPLMQLCAFLFLFSLVMGFDLGPGLPKQALSDITSGFPDLSQATPLELVWFYIENNAGKNLAVMLLGVVGGVLPVILIVFNGFVLGWICSVFAKQYGLFATVVGILPHGVFEITAIIISMSMGMGIGYQFINTLRGKKGLGAEVKLALGFFATRMLPLFVIAAFVEAFVTPILLMVFL